MGILTLAVEYAERIRTLGDYQAIKDQIKISYPDTMEDGPARDEAMKSYYAHETAMQLFEDIMGGALRNAQGRGATDQEEILRPAESARIVKGTGSAFFDGWEAEGDTVAKHFIHQPNARHAQHIMGNMLGAYLDMSPYQVDTRLNPVIRTTEQESTVAMPAHIFRQIKKDEIESLGKSCQINPDRTYLHL